MMTALTCMTRGPAMFNGSDRPCLDSETSCTTSSSNSLYTLLHHSHRPKTFLSPSVHTLLVDDFSSINDSVPAVIDSSSLSLNWSAIETFISDNIQNDNAASFDHRQYSRELRSIAKHVYTIVMEKSMSEMYNIFTWTHNSRIYNECLELLLFKRSPLDIHLSLLLLTTAIERTLRDVYLHVSKVKTCPQLLRDLLAAKELENIFGRFPMVCLQCLIGPPSGFNLRNIIWHGFFMEGEIPIELVVFLLVIIGNFHQSLVPLLPINPRPFITFPQETVMKGIFPDFNESDIDNIHQLFCVSSFVVPFSTNIWQNALKYYKIQNYGYFILLILPCLEHSLRHIFAYCNRCPERVLTAESSVLYTTFDEILSPTLHDDSMINIFPNEIGTSHMELLLDLLVHPEGPRLRDRVSHGEVDVAILSKTLADYILGITVSFCLHYTEHVNNKIIHLSIANDYQSLFHPSSILKRELLELLSEMSKWALIGGYHENDNLIVDVCFFENYTTTLKHLVTQFPIVRRSEEVVDFAVDPTVDPTVDPIVDPTVDPTVEILEQLSDPTLLSGFNVKPVESLIKQVWSRPIKTLYMKRSDVEITGLLRQSVNHLITAIKQILVTATERYQSHINRNMRSRQRANFERLLSNFYKKVLQFTENLSSQTSPLRNRWEEGEKHCKLLIQHCNKFEYITTTTAKRIQQREKIE